MKTKTLTKNEILSFIARQPDDKPLDATQGYLRLPGPYCVLAEYGMNYMATITKQQLLDFINEQPDNYPLDTQYGAIRTTAPHCILAHYGKEQGLIDGSGGIRSVWGRDEDGNYHEWDLETDASDIISAAYDWRGVNYGELKQWIKNENWN
jgi:hypothetical protein